MLASHFFVPGSHLLQSPPAASHIPGMHGVVFMIAVPSALHMTSESPSHDGFPGAQTASVHSPSILLHSPTVSQSLSFLKLMPSGPHCSSAFPVQRCSCIGMQVAQVLLASPT